MTTEERSISVGAARSGLAAKFIALFCLVAAATVSTATATDFQSLAEQGYRWVRVNGPYATPNNSDAPRLAGAKSTATAIDFKEKAHAHFLLPGLLLFVLRHNIAACL